MVHRKRCKITPENVTGDTKKELRSDIKNLTRIKNNLERTHDVKKGEPKKVYTLVNDIIKAKKKKMEMM